MRIFDEAKRAHRQRVTAAEPQPTAGAAASTRILGRQTTVPIDGADVEIEEPNTTQTSEENWLTDAQRHGRPRGTKAIQARKISQTAAMEAITNGIVDQLVGGELTAESDDDELSGAEAELWALMEDVILGPHPMGNDLDDLLTAAVADMMGPGNAYWQLLPSADGSLPVAAMVPLDALTIRHNVNRHGFTPDGEPPYWQARGAFSSEGIAPMGNVTPVALEAGDIAVMHYPRGKRPYQIYPKSPSLQVLEWLEILTNSTTHHNRYYSDNELPPGFIQVLNASNRTVEDVKDKLQAAKGDPRSVEVIGGEGQAMWVEMGGTAINLDVIQEQQWFLELCLGSLGLGKAELGLIEDVNRANGEIEASRVYKRIAGPFSKQFQNAFVHIARQFDVYNNLDAPFKPTLRFTDPRAERAREERLRQMYNDGALTLRQYVRRRGDADVGDNEFTVEINGVEVDYGDYPKWLARELVAEARSSDNRPMADEGEDEEQAADPATIGPLAHGEPHTNGDGA